MILSDRSRFLEEHPKYQEFRAYMKKRLREILNELSREEEKRQEERAFQDLNEDLDDCVRDINKAARQMFPKEEQEREERERAVAPQQPVPKPENPNPRKRRAGSIKIGELTYHVETSPLGRDARECVISDSILFVNADHPTFQATLDSRDRPALLRRVLLNAILSARVQNVQEYQDLHDSLIRNMATYESHDPLGE